MLIFTALTSGVIIAFLEAACTGQVYLPVLVFMYKQNIEPFRSMLLILWYNFMFILPLLFVFVLAYSGVKSDSFNAWLKKNIYYIKIMLSFIFLMIGLFLIISG